MSSPAFSWSNSKRLLFYNFYYYVLLASSENRKNASSSFSRFSDFSFLFQLHAHTFYERHSVQRIGEWPQNFPFFFLFADKCKQTSCCIHTHIHINNTQALLPSTFIRGNESVVVGVVVGAHMPYSIHVCICVYMSALVGRIVFP